MIVIRLNAIKFAYISELIFDDLKFSVHDDRCIGLIGQNGSGKTSLLEKTLKDLTQKKMLKNIPVRTLVISGKPAYEIVNLAAEEKADIIVIATHGESGWQKFLFGSVTEKVIRMAACPVLTIQQPKDA